MLVTEKLARYILALQSISELEIGFEKNDKYIRTRLEKTFPILLEEQEKREFDQWLWSVYVERQPSVKKIRLAMDTVDHSLAQSDEWSNRLFAQKDIEQERALESEATVKAIWLKERKKK